MHTDNSLNTLARLLLKKISATTLCLILGLSGCSHFSNEAFPLSSVNSEKQVHIAQQQWQLDYKNNHYSFQVIVERALDHWQWIMLDNLSQRLATVSVSGGKVSIEQHQIYFPKALLPELLEALQFSYWPIADLQQTGLANWTIQASRDHRDIYFSGILRAVVSYQSPLPSSRQNPSLRQVNPSPWQGNPGPWQGNLSYDNKKSNFQLRIESQVLN